MYVVLISSIFVLITLVHFFKLLFPGGIRLAFSLLTFFPEYLINSLSITLLNEWKVLVVPDKYLHITAV